MTLNTSQRDMMEMRRAAVARLRLRGLTLREIALALAKGDAKGQGRILNPDTGEPYSNVTILNDLKALSAEWKENAQADISEHRARQIAEIEQVKRQAWSDSDGALALRAIELEMKLLGTNAPIKIDISTTLQARFVETVHIALSAGMPENEIEAFLLMWQERVSAYGDRPRLVE